jgi:glycogen debranching enzyme
MIFARLTATVRAFNRTHLLSRARQRMFARAVMLTVFILLPGVAQETSSKPQLTRAIRPWEFFSSVGARAGLFGSEGGNLEAWVYPLKIFRNFHLIFNVEGRALPAESVARTITARPESCTIVYAGDAFTVRETFFVPINEPAAVILFEIETRQPLEIEAAFQRDFQLEWPAALGGTYINWEPNLRAFYFGEEQKKFSAFVGSPAAADVRLEYQTNYSASEDSSFHLGITSQGRDAKQIVITASLNGRDEAENTYKRVASNYSALLKSAEDYYTTYLSHTVSLELPDWQLQEAYDWARISVVQGLVNNPLLGTGLIAGYRTSGQSQRPGFAWFFGRDSMWTALALDAEGDFATARTALEFISKYQRADGKIPHEISQGAGFVDWFKDYPYPYASVDATPLYIVAMEDYLTSSGDVSFVRQKWEGLWKAYEFLRSTYDPQGWPQNFGFGHGWVEGGPLLPVKTEFYQSALGTQALLSLSNIAHLLGKEDMSKQLADDFARKKPLLNRAFWSGANNRFVFALDQNNQQIDELSVLATVPMWFGLLDDHKAGATISQLASHDHQTDWGMRIISSQSPKYNPGGYHFGSVWPLFTGWASVGEYRYHRALAAYSNLRADALMALDGSLGHVTEVLSGDYYQPLSTSSPHQIWSAAMVISPMLRGLLGLKTDAGFRTLRFTPHFPADWSSLAVNNVRIGEASLALRYQRKVGEISLQIAGENSSGDSLEFSPALSARATVVSAEMNGRAIPFRVAQTETDQHVYVRVLLSPGTNTLRLRMANDFDVGLSSTLPPLGSKSRGLRVISESWSRTRDRLDLDVSGAAGEQYELPVWNPAQVSAVDGAELVGRGANETHLRVKVPDDGTNSYPNAKIVLHFAGAQPRQGSHR